LFQRRPASRTVPTYLPNRLSTAAWLGWIEYRPVNSSSATARPATEPISRAALGSTRPATPEMNIQNVASERTMATSRTGMPGRELMGRSFMVALQVTGLSDIKKISVVKCRPGRGGGRRWGLPATLAALSPPPRRHGPYRNPAVPPRHPRPAARLGRAGQGGGDRAAAAGRGGDRCRPLRRCAGHAGRPPQPRPGHARHLRPARADRAGEAGPGGAGDRGDPHRDPGAAGGRRAQGDPDRARRAPDHGPRGHPPPRRRDAGP